MRHQKMSHKLKIKYSCAQTQGYNESHTLTHLDTYKAVHV